MRLIDADTLSNAMYRKSFETDDGRQRWDGDLWIRYKVFEEARDEAPTIDAVPVRHGKWERNSARIAGWVKCSECGNMEPLLCTTRFCGNCGALMEEYDEAD